MQRVKLAEGSTYIPRPIKIEKKHEEEQQQQQHQEEEEEQGEAQEEGEEAMPGADDIIQID